MCRSLKFVCKMVLISFLCLFTWENRLLCLNLCCFGKTKVEMLKFVALMARYLTNNLWKFHQKILNYSENNKIFVGGCFFGCTRYRKDLCAINWLQVNTTEFNDVVLMTVACYRTIHCSAKRVCPSVYDVGGSGPHWLKILETNCANN